MTEIKSKGAFLLTLPTLNEAVEIVYWTVRFEMVDDHTPECQAIFEKVESRYHPVMFNSMLKTFTLGVRKVRNEKIARFLDEHVANICGQQLTARYYQNAERFDYAPAIFWYKEKWCVQNNVHTQINAH